MKLNDFIEKFVEQFDDAPAVEFTAETRFREVDGWTSLIALFVIGMIDEEYNITIKAEDMRKANTIGELFEIVKAKA